MDTLRFNINPKEWIALIIITFILAWVFFGFSTPEPKVIPQVSVEDIGASLYEVTWKNCHYIKYSHGGLLHMVNCPNTHIADTVVIKQLIEFE